GEYRRRCKARQPLALPRDSGQLVLEILQRVAQAGRAIQVVVRVGGHVVHEALAQQLDREASDELAEVAAQRAARDRAQESLLDEGGETLGLLLEQRRALGVGQHDRLAATADAPQRR